MKHDRFEVVTSILIAIVTICGALTAWRASVASIESDNADFDGLGSAIRAQQERISNSVTAYEHLRAYTSYYRYNELGKLIDDEVSFDSDRERSELFGIALGLQYTFFPSRYLDRDGNYEINRELEELWAESNASKDLNPVPHFDRADVYREKANILTLMLIVFASSFFFLALSQAFKNFLRFAFAGIGTVALIGGVCAVLIFEFSL